ncbi:MAG: 7TM-DISM domain-containing protein [Pseudomonadota bacterium]
MGVVTAWFIASPAARAQAIAVQDGLTPMARFDYFYDPSGALGLEDVKRPPLAASFRPFGKTRLVARDRAGAHWFRFTIAPGKGATAPLLLLFSQGDLEGYDLWLEGGAGKAHRRRLALGEGARDADALGNGIGHLVRQTGEAQRVHVRLYGKHIDGAFAVQKPAAWTAASGWRARLFWAAGALAALALAAASAAALRWRRLGHALPALAAAGVLGLAAWKAGFLDQSPALWEFANQMHGALLPWVVGILLLAIRRAVRLERVSAWLDRGVTVLAGLAGGVGLGGLFYPGHGLLSLVALVPAASLGALIVGVKCWPLRRWPAALVMTAALAVGLGLAPWVYADLAHPGFPAWPTAPALFVAAGLACLMVAMLPWVPAGAPRPAPALAQASGHGIAGVLSGLAKPLPAGKENEEDALAKDLAAVLHARLDMVKASVARQRDDDAAQLQGGEITVPFADLPDYADMVDEGEKLLAGVRQGGTVASVALIALDGHEHILATHGQIIAQRAFKLLLVTAAGVLKESDKIGHFGPRRLLALLVGAHGGEAALFTRRLARALMERSLPTSQGMLQLGAAIAHLELQAQDAGFETVLAQLEGALDEADGAIPERAAG